MNSKQKFTCPNCNGHHFKFAGETKDGLLIRYCPNRCNLSLLAKIKIALFPFLPIKFEEQFFTFTNDKDYLYFH